MLPGSPKVIKFSTKKESLQADTVQVCLCGQQLLSGRTWPVKGEDVAFTFGSTLGCVGLRAAAGAPPTLPLGRNLLVSGRVQIWVHMGEQPSTHFQ